MKFFSLSFSFYYDDNNKVETRNRNYHLEHP